MTLGLSIMVFERYNTTRKLICNIYLNPTTNSLTIASLNQFWSLTNQTQESGTTLCVFKVILQLSRANSVFSYSQSKNTKSSSFLYFI